MPTDALKEIGDLLENILVFEIKFKEEILAKAENFSDVKLKKLKNILFEVGQWQERAVDKKIKEDPNFYNKIANVRKKVDQEIISLYKQKLNDEDHKKIEIILEKISEA